MPQKIRDKLIRCLCQQKLSQPNSSWVDLNNNCQVLLEPLQDLNLRLKLLMLKKPKRIRNFKRGILTYLSLTLRQQAEIWYSNKLLLPCTLPDKIQEKDSLGPLHSKNLKWLNGSDGPKVSSPNSTQLQTLSWDKRRMLIWSNSMLTSNSYRIASRLLMPTLKARNGSLVQH